MLFFTEKIHEVHGAAAKARKAQVKPKIGRTVGAIKVLIYLYIYIQDNIFTYLGPSFLECA